jgi:hypothetical protein
MIFSVWPLLEFPEEPEELQAAASATTTSSTKAAVPARAWRFRSRIAGSLLGFGGWNMSKCYG